MNSKYTLKMIANVIFLSLSFFSIAVNAAPPKKPKKPSLYINNQTKKSSTCLINYDKPTDNDKCSTYWLGNDGITLKGTVSKFTNTQLLLACHPYESDCTALIYMSDNCSGEPIATAKFSLETGIKEQPKMLSPLYEIEYKNDLDNLRFDVIVRDKQQ